MNRRDWTLVGALYVPVALALLAGLLGQRHTKRFAACLLGFLWVLPSLLIVQHINLAAGWWQFPSAELPVAGMPLELYLGWIVLWGILPPLALRRLPLVACTLIFVTADVIAMPLCEPVVRLSPHWLTGELVAVLVVLVPALCLGRWTIEDSHLRLRSAMQVATASLLFLYFLPEFTFAYHPGQGWTPLLALPSWQKQLAWQLLLFLSIPGINAVMEFAGRGLGTPIPYDPPKRLVTSGIYRYCANPMQLSCGLVMCVWAMLLQNSWLFAAAALAGIYSAGVAEWDERQDLLQRFGPEWKAYRRQVKGWRLRCRPYFSGEPARLYIAATCAACSELRAWIERRNPIGLEILVAETHPASALRRLRYEPADGSAAVEGVRALGRALEHLHLLWALAGMTLRLPIVWQCTQLVMDASGLGPRDLRVRPMA
jgi:protein-S-isoprenylcysteine O-methyltransferase Ste14